MNDVMSKTCAARLRGFIDRRTTPIDLTPDDGIKYWQERLLLVIVFVGAILWEIWGQIYS